MHHGFTVGFLVKRDAHHVNLAFKAEFLGGKGKGRAPLSGTGLGGKTFDTLFGVVIGLGNGGVWLVRSNR